MNTSRQILMLLCANLIFVGVEAAPTLPSPVVTRDPTQPPVEYAAPVRSDRNPLDLFKIEHLVTINGTRYLVYNSRRYAVGDTVEGARIERISESAVWLQSPTGSRKLTLFSGIEKQPVSLPNSHSPTNSIAPVKMDGKKGIPK